MMSNSSLFGSSSLKDALRLAARSVLRGVRCFWYSKIDGIKLSGSPIFIVGCGHSGTTLLLAMMDSHSKIHGIPRESAVAFLPESDFVAEMERFDKDTVCAGKRRWAEKTPSHVRCIGRILQDVPDCKVIIMVRDGRDVAYSLFNRLNSLEKAVERWIEDNQKALAYAEHPRVLMVRYEDLIASPSDEMRRVMTFVGEQFEPAQLQFHNKKRRWYSNIMAPTVSVTEGASHKQHRNWQVNQPLFDGRGRYKDFSKRQLDYVDERVRILQEYFGYHS